MEHEEQLSSIEEQSQSFVARKRPFFGGLVEHIIGPASEMEKVMGLPPPEEIRDVSLSPEEDGKKAP